MIGMGDHLECATKDSIGAGVWEVEEILDRQREEFYENHKDLKILGLHIGNHEWRVYQHSGLNITKWLCEQLHCKYLGLGMLHVFYVGRQEYTIYTTHGHTYARFPHTKLKAITDLERMILADIYVMGHSHQLAYLIREKYIFNSFKKELELREIFYILSGSYLAHWESYAHKRGYEPLKLGSAVVTLYGEERKVEVKLIP